VTKVESASPTISYYGGHQTNGHCSTVPHIGSSMQHRHARRGGVAPLSPFRQNATSPERLLAFIRPLLDRYRRARRSLHALLRLKLFDERALGAGTFMTARLTRDRRLAWERTEIYRFAA
jgi:hypothetical protein